MHARCGRNRALTVSVPPEPLVVESPTLLPIPPYYHSLGVHARCRGVYYSLYIAFHASHTLDRVPHPLIRNGRRSRPVVPHQYGIRADTCNYLVTRWDSLFTFCIISFHISKFIAHLFSCIYFLYLHHVIDRIYLP